MVTDARGHELMPETQPPTRAAINGLVAGIRDIMTFATLAAADAWATANPTVVKPGDQVWITAENAVYVRSGDAWRRLWAADAVRSLAIHLQQTNPINVGGGTDTFPVCDAAQDADGLSLASGAVVLPVRGWYMVSMDYLWNGAAASPVIGVSFNGGGFSAGRMYAFQGSSSGSWRQTASWLIPVPANTSVRPVVRQSGTPVPAQVAAFRVALISTL
ncbi:hypothetical protein DNL40_02270 [Xylanimonas oleitrophica]|uniref:Uncharacterized protein n=1 Tax=Xylanimonas oleitrophica TaxID=2607479 RepID=A0A2W5X444_9MICO|nr:hypothetical protein [Xylanimonas oleitrophica]PZR55215.1 hypothetical protein DNL40_02270 [Xylanimonas oleitrophica]